MTTWVGMRGKRVLTSRGNLRARVCDTCHPFAAHFRPCMMAVSPFGAILKSTFMQLPCSHNCRVGTVHILGNLLCVVVTTRNYQMCFGAVLNLPFVAFGRSPGQWLSRLPQWWQDSPNTITEQLCSWKHCYQLHVQHRTVYH